MCVPGGAVSLLIRAWGFAETFGGTTGGDFGLLSLGLIGELGVDCCWDMKDGGRDWVMSGGPSELGSSGVCVCVCVCVRERGVCKRGRTIVFGPQQ